MLPSLQRETGKQVLVEWVTKTEIDNLGFNLYKSTEKEGIYTKLNNKLIPGLVNSVSGRRYTYDDVNVVKGKLYYYKLEDIDLKGKKTLHGPVCVDWDGDGIPDDIDPTPGQPDPVPPSPNPGPAPNPLIQRMARRTVKADNTVSPRSTSSSSKLSRPNTG